MNFAQVDILFGIWVARSMGDSGARTQSKLLVYWAHNSLGRLMRYEQRLRLGATYGYLILDPRLLPVVHIKLLVWHTINDE